MTIMDELVGMSTVQTGRWPVCEEDELLLEIELCRLQQQMQVIQSDMRPYLEETYNVIRFQRAEIQVLNDLNEEITKRLALAEIERTQGEDARIIYQLLGLMHILDEYKYLVKKEENKLRELDGEILSAQEMILGERKLAVSAADESRRMRTMKPLRVMKNRLDTKVIKYNIHLASNAQLRKEIDQILIQKSVYDSIRKDVNDQMKEMKSAINASITQAAHAHKERDAAQSKMVALKDQSDKDNAQHEKELAELRQIIRHDNQLKHFMAIKQQDRTDLWEELTKKLKDKDKRDKILDYEKQSLWLFGNAFRQITVATCEHDVTKIVNDFSKRDDENFAIYNYVNESNDRVKNIQGEITRIQREIKVLEEDDITNVANRDRLLREIEIKAENRGKESDYVEAKYINVNNVLDDISIDVSLFKILSQFSHAKSHHSRRTSARCRTSTRRMPGSINAPSMTDYDDIMLEDGKTRPYTRNEIKSFTKQIKPFQKPGGNRNKAKSRN